jgi:DNA helicase II / ATP-dependent DNA helicase PcrA
MTDHLKGLNPQQREAVEYGVKPGNTKAVGPLLVIAGAGSGKTKTLAHRVAHLVANGADPRRILLLTFTRRARQRNDRAGAAHCSRCFEGSKTIYDYVSQLTMNEKPKSVGDRL